MILTNWGYEIDAQNLPEILTQADFNAMTLGKYSGDQRVPYTLASITSALRNYAGWHLASNVKCSVTYSFDDLHLTRTSTCLIIQLPSRCVTSIEKIKIDNNEINSYYFIKQNGTLKIYDCLFFKTITIEFMSGLSDDAGLKNIVASRVSNALSGPIGVSSEAAGGVSISYTNSYVAGTNASSLLTADKEYLEMYKITELL